MDNLTCPIIIIIIIAASLVQFSNCKFYPPPPNSPQLARSAKFAAVAVVGWGRREAKGGVSKTHICFVATARTCCFGYDQVSEEEDEDYCLTAG
jgi:hypothetical protein